MRITSLILFLVFLFGCYSSNKTVRSNQVTNKSIIETKQEANLTDEQEKLIRATLVENILLYTESCEKRKEIKSPLNQLIFLKIAGKNPPRALLNFLNNKFDVSETFLAAKEGVSVFSSGILIGYESIKNQKKGYVISVSIKNQDKSTASVDLSESRTSLGGVYKTYQLKKSNSNWKITGCNVNAYN